MMKKKFAQVLAAIILLTLVQAQIQVIPFAWSADDEPQAAVTQAPETVEENSTPSTPVVEEGNTPAVDSVAPEVTVSPGDTASSNTPAPETAPEIVPETIPEIIPETSSETTPEVSSTTATSTIATSTVVNTVVSDSRIVSGNSTAEAVVTNVVNVNLFESEALLAMLSRLSDGGAQNVDLRDLSFEYDGFLGCADCSISTSTLDASTTGSYLATTTNDVVIENNIVASSTSGSNSAVTRGNGDAVVVTGDSYANATVVNIANTTLVDSRYMMLVLSNYGDWNGDLVLPTASFFENLMSGRPAFPLPSLADISISNAATIQNQVSTEAVSGDNSATSTLGDSVVITGDAVAGSTVLNDVNETHIGGSAVAIVFRIYGAWTGKAFNVPAGFVMKNTESGVELVSISADQDEIAGIATSGGSLTVSGTNAAVISNNVDVSATTGGNRAVSEDGLSAVVTGDAYANASLINVVNTTSISRNWFGAIINVFGDWGGNVSFGQPDLWVGTSASFEDGNGPGAPISFKYTVKNNGDAAASGISLRHEFGSGFASFDGEGTKIIEIGSIPAGEAMEISEKALISNFLPYGETAISSRIEISLDETDGNKEDNEDVISIVAFRPGSIGGSFYRNSAEPPEFIVTKTNSGVASSTVSYTIVIENKGGIARDAVVVDEIFHEGGESINRQTWELGDVFDDEIITITYDMAFSSSTKPGEYVNHARVVSSSGDFSDSGEATSSVVIAAPYVKVTKINSGEELVVVEKVSLGRMNGPARPLSPEFFRQFRDEKDDRGAMALLASFWRDGGLGGGGGGKFGGTGGSNGGLLAAVGNLDLRQTASLWQLVLLLVATAWLGYMGVYRRP